MSQSLGIVIPAFNPDIERLRDYIRGLTETVDPSVIRVEIDDPDPEHISAVSTLPATVAISDTRRGKGTAITAGFEALETDILAFADADGSTAPTEFKRIISSICTESADLAVGSRRHPQSIVSSHQTFARRRLGDAFAATARLLLDAPLYDYQCGAKAITADTWSRVRSHLHEQGFAWDIELIALAAATDARIVEVPIEWEDMPGSTVSPLSDGLHMARGLVVSRHRSRVVSGDRVHTYLNRKTTETPSLIERIAETGAGTSVVDPTHGAQ